MAWGRTHNIIQPVGNNQTITTSKPFNERGNALPPIDCCKALELQIQDIYRRICLLQDNTTSFNLIYNSSTSNLSLTIDNVTQTVNIPSSKPVVEDKVYYGNQFVNNNTLLDSTLVNLRFRLFYRAMGSYLIRGTEWDYNSFGGFMILINGFIVDPSDIFFVQFY